MLSPKSGVPLLRTPFFFHLSSLLVLCACLTIPTPAQAAASPEPLGNTLTAPTGEEHRTGLPEGVSSTTDGQRVVLFADWLSYEETTGNLEARGNVRLWYNQLTLTAEEADADLEAQVIFARGDVRMFETDREIHCAKLDYHIQDQRVRAEGIIFATHPWYYQGTSVEKTGEKEVVISEARFTTCDARRPHYHLTAQRIDVVLGESLTAYNAVLYIGTTPVFYLPWIRRSLADARPPFSIEVGYNDFEGFFAKLKFNYFLAEKNYGGLLLNLMEKKGVGVGVEHHLEYEAWGKGVADLSVLYVRDQEVNAERWSAFLTDRHEITDRDLLQLNLEFLSDQSFNREFSSLGVDSHQQKSYLAYSHRGDQHYYGFGVNDTQTWQPKSESDPGFYYTSSRSLPTANYTLSSAKIADILRPIYFSLSSNFDRRYERLEVDDLTTGLTDIRNRYLTDIDATPGFRQTYTSPVWVLTQPSLSGSISFPVSLEIREDYFEDYAPDAAVLPNDFDASYSTSLTLTNKWVNYRYTTPTHLMQTQLGYHFTRQFPSLADSVLPNDGVSSHRLSLTGDYYMGNFFYLQSTTGYDLLHSLEEGDWRALMDALGFNGRVTLSSQTSLTWQGNYDWVKERITTGYASTNTSGKNWTAGFTTSYSYLGQINQDYSLFGTLNGTYRPFTGLALNTNLQYDFVNDVFTNFTLGMSRDLHCWAMSASIKVYADGALSVGFGLNLKAFPDVKVGMGGGQSIAVGN